MPREKRHVLTDLDHEARTAVCAFCGPVEFVTNTTIRKYPTCVVAARHHRRANNIRRTYGITLTQWADLLLSQTGRCAICGVPMADPHVDHDHTTGRIRGMLCNPCNHGLGQFRDRPDLLRIAARYLESG